MLGRALESIRQRGAERTARKLTPPIELIAANNVGIHDKEHVLEEYGRIGRGIAGSLKSHAGMRPDSDVLDVGCGTGRVAIPLTSYLTTGTYNGIDVTESSIRWCQDAFKNFSNFRFFHANLYSEFYNPEATQTAENYQFPFQDDSFDVIWSASLFTHLFLPAVDNYLREMARVAKPGAKIWNSYLLLDELSEPLVLGPRNDGRRMQF